MYITEQIVMLNYAECLGKPMEALPDMKEEAKNRNVGKQFRKIEKKKQAAATSCL